MKSIIFIIQTSRLAPQNFLSHRYTTIITPIIPTRYLQYPHSLSTSPTYIAATISNRGYRKELQDAVWIANCAMMLYEISKF